MPHKYQQATADESVGAGISAYWNKMYIYSSTVKEYVLTRHLALNAALSQLGLKPYDYEDRLDLGHFPVWTEALHRKYHCQGSGLGRELFDSLMDGFDVCSYSPSSP